MKTPIAIMTADIHARNTVPACRVDDFVAAQRRKLEWIRTNMPEGVAWLDAGDLFHSWRSAPETEVMLMDALRDIPFWSIPGNHEIPYHNLNRLGNSSWRVLEAAGRVRRAVPDEEKAVPAGLYSWGEWFHSSTGISVAICHGMVWPEKPNYPGIEGIGARELLQAMSEYDIILTGHNHQTFVVEDGKRKLVNPGSLMRSAIDQREHRPCFFVLYDDCSVDPVFIPIEADVFADDVYARQEDRDDRMQAFLERVQNTEGFSLSYTENVKAYCQQNEVPPPVQAEINNVLGGE